MVLARGVEVVNNKAGIVPQLRGSVACPDDGTPMAPGHHPLFCIQPGSLKRTMAR